MLPYFQSKDELTNHGAEAGRSLQLIEPFNLESLARLTRNQNYNLAQPFPHTRFFLTSLGEPLFLEVLEKVTGIMGLVPDPYWYGGGLHFTRSGGKLAIHADFNKHFKFKLDRRLNLLVYLNHGWTDENQGWLELWDRDMKSCVRRVLPIFNRTVLFSTTDFSYHGQPEPIEGPPELFRRSIALYYYSNGRPGRNLRSRSHRYPLEGEAWFGVLTFGVWLCCGIRSRRHRPTGIMCVVVSGTRRSTRHVRTRR